MAQVDEIVSSAPRVVRVISKSVDVAVAQAGDTTVLDLDVSMISRLVVELAVVAQALDACKIYGRAMHDGSYVPLITTAAQFLAGATGILTDCSGDITTQSAGTSGYMILDVLGWEKIRITCSSANVAGSTVSVYAGGS
jgi:hypothetical protein